MKRRPGHDAATKTGFIWGSALLGDGASGVRPMGIYVPKLSRTQGVGEYGQDPGITPIRPGRNHSARSRTRLSHAEAH